MKTTKLLFIGILGLTSFWVNAQATQALNNITPGSYLGTSNDEDLIFKRNGENAGKISSTNATFGLGAEAGPSSISIGMAAGYESSLHSQNSFVGESSGQGATNGESNSFLGYFSGFYYNGAYSTCIGSSSGMYALGDNNTYQGQASGIQSSGNYNVAVGVAAGNSFNGSANTFIGTQAGEYLTGGDNICIGRSAGREQAGDFNIYVGANSSNGLSMGNNIVLGSDINGDFAGGGKLLIEGSFDAQAPLIWGDFYNDQLKFNAKVGIGYGIGDYPTSAGGVDVSGYNLFVMGGILVDEARIAPSANNTWADYVFHKNYTLKPLAQLEQFISDNGHLPNVPSACQVQEEGIALGEMAKIQQEKIEELTLYIIEQNKTNEAQNKLIMQLSERLNAIEKR